MGVSKVDLTCIGRVLDDLDAVEFLRLDEELRRERGLGAKPHDEI